MAEDHGVDGPWIDAADVMTDRTSSTKVDLVNSLWIDRNVDFTWPVDTAEHFDIDRADDFLDDPNALALPILFTAAISRNGGPVT